MRRYRVVAGRAWSQVRILIDRHAHGFSHALVLVPSARLDTAARQRQLVAGGNYRGALNCTSHFHGPVSGTDRSPAAPR